MNVISNGLFFKEIDAVENNETLAKQFVSIWEKKNSKAARAGGASLMALSLAACGGSDGPSVLDDLAAALEAAAAAEEVVEEAVEEVAAEEEAVVPEAVVSELTISQLRADTTFLTTSDLDGGAGTADELSLTISANFAGFVVDPDAADQGSMVGFEVVSLAADALARVFDATGVSGVEKYKIDGSNGGVVSITDSADFAEIVLSNIASGAFSITYAAPTGGASPVAGTADNLGVTVEGLGSKTSDVSITAAGVEILSITSNAAATASGQINYIETSATGAAKLIVGGNAHTDIGAVAPETTSFDGSEAVGGVTVDLRNAATESLTEVTTGRGDDAVTIQWGDFYFLGARKIDTGLGKDKLIVTGPTDGHVRWDIEGVETLDLSGVTGGSASIELGGSDAFKDVALGNETGAYAGQLVLHDRYMDEHEQIADEVYNVLGNSSGSITTHTTGSVFTNVSGDADATKVSSETSAVTINADKASLIDITVIGEVDWDGKTSAAEAKTVTIDNASGRAQEVWVDAPQAETVTIISNGEDTTLIASSNLSGAKDITVSTKGAFQDSSVEGFAAAHTVRLIGIEEQSAATFDQLVGSTTLSYDLDITVSRMGAGVTLTNGADAGAGALDFDAQHSIGAVSTGDLDGESVVVRIGALSTLTTGQIDADTVSIFGANSIRGFTLSTGSDGTIAGNANDITANDVLIHGSSISDNSADILAQPDGTELLVSLFGDTGNDAYTIGSTSTVKKTVIKGDLARGTDIVEVTLADYNTDATETVVLNMTKFNSSAHNVDVNIFVAAETDNDMTIRGTRGSDDFVDFGTDTTLTGRTIALIGIDKVGFDDGTVAEAAMLHRKTIELTGDMGGATMTLNGTAGDDRINLTNITTSNTSDFIIAASEGDDTIMLGALSELVRFEAVATNGVDTITGFTVGTDDLDVSATLLTSAITAEVAIVAAAAAHGAINNDDVFYVSTDGTAANLTTAGTATLDLDDFTATTLTDVAAYLDEHFNSTGVATDQALFAVNHTATGGLTYLYSFTEGAGATVAMEAAEFTLVASIDGDVILTTGDLV
ncbi:hypothetical protein N9O45_03775 [Planktomarina temperata]|nr:hypothetical protein [Planktomarina temperata]